jgi:hypothetical protein
VARPSAVTDFESVVTKADRLFGINPTTICDGSAPLAMLMKSIDNEGSTGGSTGAASTFMFEFESGSTSSPPSWASSDGAAGPVSTENCTDSRTGSSRL